MAEMVIKIMVELLSALGLVTKQIEQKRPSTSAVIDTSVNLMQCSEIHEETVGREGGRGGAAEAGPTDARRGSDNRSADHRGRLWSCAKHEGGREWWANPTRFAKAPATKHTFL
jgi:hypothetical protein